MPIIIDSSVRLPKEEFTNEALNEITTLLTYRNPEWDALKRLADNAEAAGYHGRARGMRYKLQHTPKVLHDYFEQPGVLFIPRGAWKRIQQEGQAQVLREMNPHVADNRIRGREIDISINANLYDYQVEAANALLTEEDGLVEAACGGGKTVTGIAAICLVRSSTFILTHELKLVKQWQSELRDKCKGNFTIGEFTGKKREIGDVTVGTVQTLSNLTEAEWQVLLGQFGVLIVDEVHHAPASTFYHAINRFPAFYRWGFTATPKRKDRLEFRLFDAVGSIVHKVEDEKLIDEGRVTSATVRFVPTGIFLFNAGTNWTGSITVLVQSAPRNDRITGNIAHDVSDGRKVLVLSDRVEHCEEIAVRLKNIGVPRVELLLGRVGAEDRERIRKDETINVIVGTRVADEGLDVPWLDTIHLTCPCNAEGKVKQRIGRIRRVCDGKKEPLVYDYCDRGHTLENMARNRRKWYANWGFRFEQW